MLRKIFASSANSRHTLLAISGISLINIRNSVGPTTESCGIPLLTHAQDESSAPMQTLCFLAFKNDFIQLCTLPVIPKFLTLSRSLWCGTESKAFAKSVYMISIDSPSSTILVQISIHVSRFVTQFLLGTNPCWSFKKILFLFMWSTLHHYWFHNLTNYWCKTHWPIISYEYLLALSCK